MHLECGFKNKNKIKNKNKNKNEWRLRWREGLHVRRFDGIRKAFPVGAASRARVPVWVWASGASRRRRSPRQNGRVFFFSFSAAACRRARAALFEVSWPTARRRQPLAAARSPTGERSWPQLALCRARPAPRRRAPGGGRARGSGWNRVWAGTPASLRCGEGGDGAPPGGGRARPPQGQQVRARAVRGRADRKGRGRVARGPRGRAAARRGGARPAMDRGAAAGPKGGVQALRVSDRRGRVRVAA